MSLELDRGKRLEALQARLDHSRAVTSDMSHEKAALSGVRTRCCTQLRAERAEADRQKAD
jgi:hypothetical protein